MTGGGAVADALVAKVHTLVEELRRAGVPTGLSNLVDACVALTHVDVGSREQVRTALRCTLVADREDESVFDALFEACFAPRSRPSTGERVAGTEAAAGDDDLRDRVVAALARGDDRALAHLAGEAVERHGGLGPKAHHGDRYHLQRALRALQARGLVHDAVRARRGPGPRRDALTERLDHTEIQVALDRFMAALAGETRRRRSEQAAVSERSDAVRTVALRPEDVEITEASAVELQQLRRAVRPLARRLAARLVRRRQHIRGALDVRRTIRRSLGAGGVPLEPTFRRRSPHRPDMWLLCDVSGSVAEFARFTIGLLSAIHDEVPRLRSFLFVDDVVEVTQLLARRSHDVDPFALVVGAGAPLGGRRSDWGAALARFRDDHGDRLMPRSTLVLTGDARVHDHDPRAHVAADLVRRCRGVWLLDPEPRPQWTTGDAAVAAYRAAGVHVLEVRTLSQLVTAVDHIVTGM